MQNNNEELRRNCCDKCWDSPHALTGKLKLRFGCGLSCECHATMCPELECIREKGHTGFHYAQPVKTIDDEKLFRNFMECDTCRTQAGSPHLCYGCLHNREVIARFAEREQAVREKARKKLSSMFAERSDGGGGLKEFLWSDFIIEFLEALNQ